MIQVNTENPIEHWKYINVQDKVVLDLGCGRWEKVEYRDPAWPTTPEYWIKNGAKHVIGVDIDQEEINWFNNIFKDNTNYTFILKHINSVNDVLQLIEIYKPNIIKCDIEGRETELLNLDKDVFASIDEYYIETHGPEIHDLWIKKFELCEYQLVEEIGLTHTNNRCKVLFAKK